MQRLYFPLAILLLLLGFSCGTPKPATTGTEPAPPPPTQTAAPVANEDFRATAPEPGPAPEIQLGDFEEFELDNGLTVVLVENHKLPRVSYQLFVDVPPHLEGAYAGAQQLLGSMLRRATTDMTKEEIDEAVDFIGANLSTSGAGAYASTISKYKEEVIDLMSKVILNAEFPESEFAKVKEDARAALAQQVTSPDAIAGRVSQAITYGTNHPYGEQMTQETLDSIDLEVVKSVYDTYFVPNRSYLVMVGDLRPEEARRLATEHFSDWEERDVAVPEFPTPQRPDGVTVNFVSRPGSVQSNIIVSHPVELEPGTKASIRAGLVDQALGSGFNSRLLSNLREDKAYTYGAYSSISDDPRVGSFRAYASVRNEVTDSAVAEFLYELERLTDEPVDSAELAVAKARTMGSFGRALESPQRIASYALNTVHYDLDRDFYPEYLQVVQNSSLNDVAEVANDIVTAGNTNIIVVGDPSVADKLARFATSGTVNYYDVNGQPVDRTETAAPTDLTAEQVLNGYFDAIGGKEQALALENVSMMLEGSVQGQTLSQSMTTTSDGRMSSQTSMSGMVVADQRYAAGKAQVKQMGQAVELPEAAVQALAEQAVIFPEANYLENLSDVTLEGTEMVDGKQAVVLVVNGAGGPVREYYDAETMLKVQTIRSQGPQTLTQRYSDYQPVRGILFPHQMTLTGMAPFPIELSATSVEVNTELDPEIFTID
ncbi:putative Zn-dependent peptidase [Neolewinella xylanilytica]|uniref:Putative Zn-dependent peptidase n=1 Tax=Neolewinella xylanilytica TaxID=1514080 RepID=A0A2S6I9Y1_9BACT|nr:insulinase family protein [Neolewinella xylanilytica]PPK88301.1 putative Zn-dependent peptidase [Neolewinella xylanilytica]